MRNQTLVRKKKNSNVINNKYSSSKNTRFGIDLTKLSPIYKRLLLNRNFSKFVVDDDRAFRILQHCVDMEEDHKSYDKVYYLKNADIYTVQKNLENVINIVKTDCSYCKNNLYIDSTKYNLRDFVCEECSKIKTDDEFLDTRLINNFIKFNKEIIENLNYKYKVIKSELKHKNDSKPFYRNF